MNHSHYRLTVSATGLPSRSTAPADDYAHSVFDIAADLLKPGQLLTLETNGEDYAGPIIREPVRMALNTEGLF